MFLSRKALFIREKSGLETSYENKVRKRHPHRTRLFKRAPINGIVGELTFVLQHFKTRHLCFLGAVRGQKECIQVYVCGLRDYFRRNN